MYGPSLYDSADLDDTPPPSKPRPEPRPEPRPQPRPQPGTSLTASVETIDNDRAGGLTFSAGIVR